MFQTKDFHWLHYSKFSARSCPRLIFRNASCRSLWRMLTRTALPVWRGLVPRITGTLIGSNHVHTFSISTEIVTQGAFIYIYKKIHNINVFAVTTSLKAPRNVACHCWTPQWFAYFAGKEDDLLGCSKKILLSVFLSKMVLSRRTLYTDGTVPYLCYPIHCCH